MSVQLNKRVIRLKPSASIAAKQKVTELQAAGRRIIDLTIGEPDFDSPQHVIEAGIDAMTSGKTHYTPTPGIPQLRKAIVEKFRNENGLDVSLENVIVGTGAKQLIYEAFAATVEEGVEVIIPAPYWVSYPDMVELNGGTPVIVPCPESKGFKLTPEALEKAITPNTRWVVLNAPNNPSGALYSVEELEALAEVLKRHPHVAVMSDEIYEHIVYDGAEAVTLLKVAPELADRMLVVNGVSKAYAMTGWRLGYAAGPKELIGAIAKLIGQSTTCASSISQIAAVAALTGDQSCVAKATDLFRQRRDRMVEILKDAPGIDVTAPAGAFYLYPSVSGMIGRTTPAGKVLETDVDVAFYFLEEAGVAVLDGSAYGMSPYIRLSFGTSMDEVEAGSHALREACVKLQQLENV
ncbi:pyridoxal phosphate-dependent aminotransferase [Paracoccus actinidiae]|uniref:pyridoxal phosphate-dependent aminotransferase n=1 Tax=Paracoccus actinidiae TaxID=3064531 RepID=UPI0027D2DF56|nr:pyridoxal phosphate-dependent aminotransferase [Paracoccus sp. M09]